MSVLTLNVDEVMRTLSAESSNPFVVHDKEVDIVRFAINSGFADIVLDGQVALRVMYQRPGETEVRAQTLTYYDTDGLRNYYDWQLLSADLAKKGTLTVALCILRTDSEVEEWHTTPYQIRVLNTIHTDDSDEGDETITPTVAQRVAVLETMIQRAASGAPVVVDSASDMTDTDRIYVLTTDSKWYYYDGTEWVEGGNYGSVGTDKTLGIAGAPADSKTVGDLIYPAVESGTEERTTIADNPVLTWAQGSIGTSGSISTSNTQWIYSSVVDTTGLSGFTAEFRASQGYRYVVYFYYSDGTGERILTRTAASDPFTKDLTGVDGFRISSSPSPVAAISPSVGDDTITYIMSKTETVEVHDLVAGIKALARAEAEDVVDGHEKTQDAITPCLSVFPTFAVIGDSYSSGAIHFSDGGYVRRYDLSWCQQMARHFGGACTNYTYSGIGTKEWLTNTTYGLPVLLADTPKNLYILALGINDYTQIVNGTLTLGTVEDMTDDYTQSPDSFYGNYNRIIGNIKNHAPNARIVQLSYLRPTGGGKKMLNPVFEDIADKAGIPLVYLEDDAFFTSDFYRVTAQVDGHPTAVGYAGMATAIERLLSKCIEDNPSYFGQIGHATDPPALDVYTQIIENLSDIQRIDEDISSLKLTEQQKAALIGLLE